MRNTSLIPMALFALLSWSQNGLAQVNPAFAEITDAVEEARTILQTERKLLVMQNLDLTPAESEAFWKVYDQYAADLKKVGDRRVKVITDYAAAYDTMTDETAEKLIKESMNYETELVDLRKAYLKKFSKTLPATKVARFYQVENKLDAITNFQLARQIPLVPQKKAPEPMTKP
jgi:hypothetical protein